MQKDVFFYRFSMISGLIIGFISFIFIIIQLNLPENYDEKLNAARSLTSIIIAVYALYFYKKINPDIHFSLNLGLKISAIIAIISAIFLFLTTYSLFLFNSSILNDINQNNLNNFQLFLPFSLAFALFLQTIIASFIALIFLRKK